MNVNSIRRGMLIARAIAIPHKNVSKIYADDYTHIFIVQTTSIYIHFILNLVYY